MAITTIGLAQPRFRRSAAVSGYFRKYGNGRVSDFFEKPMTLREFFHIATIDISRPGFAFSTVAGLGISLVSDVFFVEIMRQLLRAVVRMRSLLGCIAAIATNTILGVVLVLGPFFVAPALSSVDFREPHILSFNDLLSLSLRMLCLANLWEGLLALLFISLSALMLTHVILWPIIARPIYVVASEHLLAHRKSLVLGGLGLFAPTLPAFQRLLALIGLNV